VVVAVVLWTLFAILLGVSFGAGNGSSKYGPLIPVIALLLWSGVLLGRPAPQTRRRRRARRCCPSGRTRARAGSPETLISSHRER
jgi:hypothetical protein